MLLGESVPVIKSPLVEYTHEMVHGDGLNRVDARHTLFGGTRVVELRVAQEQQGSSSLSSLLSPLLPSPSLFHSSTKSFYSFSFQRLDVL
jgi:hypothetical protein